MTLKNDQTKMITDGIPFPNEYEKKILKELQYKSKTRKEYLRYWIWLHPSLNKYVHEFKRRRKYWNSQNWLSTFKNTDKALPDFMIVGFPRCGTTSLWEHLDQHPRIYAPKDKELHFFSVRYDSGLGNYLLNFPTKKDNLYQSKIKIWKIFILTSLSPKINLHEIFKDIEDRLNLYPFEKIKYDEESSKTYYIDAHWALYCENYLEGFHVPFIHHGLNRDIALNTYKTILLKNGVLQYTLSKSNEKKIGIPSKYLNSDENVYAYYYWLFPNMMLNFYSWGISINIIEPISKNKTRIKFLSYPIDNNIQPVKLDSSLDKVEKEDQAVVLNVQKGIRSRFYSSGRYSPEHEQGIHHFHLLLNK